MSRWFVLGLFVLLAGCGLFGAKGQRSVVFFQEWSAALDDEGKGAVVAAAVWARDHPEQLVTVSGFADPEGTPQANKDISRLRAQVVSDLLMANGVPQSRIQNKAIGSVGFSFSSLESRRVEISVGAP
jgi:outer membrane protein OmpA-like peptidoglycan-associated protein